MPQLITKGQNIEDSSTILMARIVTNTGLPATQSQVESLTLRVFNDKPTGGVRTLIVPEGEDEETYEGTELVVADALSNTLVTEDVRWEEDEEGFNVLVELDGSHFPEAGSYQVELEVTPVEGHPFMVLWSFKTINIWTR